MSSDLSLSAARTTVAVYIMLGKSYEFIGLMQHMMDSGLLDSGEYFVVGVCLDTFDSTNSRNFLEGRFFSFSSCSCYSFFFLVPFSLSTITLEQSTIFFPTFFLRSIIEICY